METTGNDRFKLVMTLALYTGVLTNIYICIILIVLGLGLANLSPISGGLTFILLIYLIKRNKISARTSFLIAAYTVALEVWFHTYLLGWDSGFVFFLFLLPMVFLLDFSWSIKSTILFFSSVLIIALVLAYFFIGKESTVKINQSFLSIVYLCNLLGTCAIVLFIMFFYSQTINRKDEELVIANKELARQNEEISQQHKQLQVLVKEIHHRVKNNLQIISSLISLQRRTVDDQEVLNVLEESRGRVEAIALIHQKLYQDENANFVDFESYLQELLDMQESLGKGVKCSLKSEKAILNLDTAVPLGLIISELITNSMKHAFAGIENPELSVRLSKNDNHFNLEVKDNGIGLPTGFNLLNEKSFGCEIINALSEQINAEIQYMNDNGAKFQINFSV